jgi:hypothetical protein
MVQGYHYFYLSGQLNPTSYPTKIGTRREVGEYLHAIGFEG